MSQRDWIEFEHERPYLNCTCRWPSAGEGRWWKRQLSKARRRYAKAQCWDMRAKEPTNYERWCNWKLW